MMKNNSRGFTLAELLITVAIIGVLVAISIPIISGQLKKARAAVDVANVRSAKAAAVSDYLLACESNQETYYYDACHGVIKRSADGIKVYGKSTVDLTKENIMEDYAVGVPQDGIVEIVVAAEGVQKIAWIKETSGGDEGVEPEQSNPFADAGVEAKSWEKYRVKGQYNGITCPAGSLFVDQGQFYVFHRNNDYYQGDYRQKSLKDLMKDYPDRVKKVTSKTVIKASSEYKKGDSVDAGTIVKTSDGKYLIRCVSNKLSDEKIICNSDNWVPIKGQ